MEWWEVLIEIIKYTSPAIIVFLTVYYLMKEYFKKEYNLKALQVQSENRETTLPLKLQAYERLTLFCERIKIHALIMRLQGTAPNAAAMQSAMLITVQQEYDHNIAQQVYISENLWKIINLAKNQTIAIITDAYKTIPQGSDTATLVKELYKRLDEMPNTPLETAVAAIKKEASLLLA